MLNSKLQEGFYNLRITIQEIKTQVRLCRPACILNL